ncbi:ArnT family glycosyltransferase [Synechococcus sp. CCY9202]|uniref:ArnT family glycosyltransferase n=1 Tax=Synechococcus sp. CCY9202 TaxID=174698 RepID=UPI002B204485|nr:phospholipid carrier-dependent glycosyltransferase [Synechococcus sp. CCY9202]MEA5421782.1 phospholipid carrier-dependent glycosyltransferase [Synechococcus sp. CCY9202]
MSVFEGFAAAAGRDAGGLGGVRGGDGGRIRLCHGLLLLWGVAVLLALVGLGNLPLRDWDEGIVARVALELSQAPRYGDLLPTYWGEPYANKAPGLHLLIAQAVQLWRLLPGQAAVSGLPPEWVVRLVPALLSTLVVPLAGLIQWELRPGQRRTALATALILLCLLPVARHGRLAMLDGSQLSATALLWWSLLKVRAPQQQLWRWSAITGLAGSAQLLLKAPLLLPVLAVGLLALACDGAMDWRRWRRLGAGLLLGLLPGLGWHLWHTVAQGSVAAWMWFGDGAGRVLLSAGEGSDLGWRVPLTEVLEGGWPWLPLWPFAMGLAWRERHRAAGRWLLVLQLGMAATVLPLRTQLPWYSHPLWLPFALVCGPLLAWLIDPASQPVAPPLRSVVLRIPLFWMVLGIAGLLLALASAIPPALLPPGWPSAEALAPQRMILLAMGGGWSLGGALLLRARAPGGRSRGVAVVGAGSVLALLALFCSPFWLWELNETWPVRPVAALLQSHQVEAAGMWRQDARPSLNWYAGLPVRRLAKARDLQAAGPGGGAWVLSQDGTASPAWACRPVDAAGGWQLLRCRSTDDADKGRRHRQRAGGQGHGR